MKNYKKIETAFIHGGIQGDENTGAVNTPIYLSTTFKQEELGKDKGWEYARTANPTRNSLETLIAELEGGARGFAFASGMAAISAVLSLFKSGDKIAISGNIYGGTFRVADKVFKNFGIENIDVDTTDLAKLQESITPDVKAILLESPANPLLNITDIEAVSDIAKQKGILFIVDNTFSTPYIQRPIELGADIIIHSTSKYLGGHSDIIGGLVVTKTEEMGEKMHFIQNATGGIMQPFDAYFLIRSIKSLGVRMDRHVENAEKIAKFLDEHDAIKTVYYPGLPDAQGYEINKKQAKNGGAVVSFELADSYDYKKFFAALKLLSLAESLGGAESLVCHPVSMSHHSVPKEIRDAIGITDGLIRLSVGIEHSDDIIADLLQAIEGAKI